MRYTAVLLPVLTLFSLHPGAALAEKSAETPQDVLARTAPGDWRAVDPEHTAYLELPTGRVVIELAPEFAPRHAANVVTLVRQHYFDGLSIVRFQDNYVLQLDDPTGKRSLGAAEKSLPREFDGQLRADEPFVRLSDGDVYAPEVGFVDSWPVARDPGLHKQWLIHCYGMLGAGREDPPDNGTGAELYVVMGQSPRQLDRNVALFGRVIRGIEQLSSLPRGTGNIGFYEGDGKFTPIRSLKMAADVPPADRTDLEVLRSDAPVFLEYLRALRTRRASWFVEPTNRLEICNVPVPVRNRTPGR